MSTRNDKLRELAARIRADHTAAAFVVGWYAARAPEQELDELLAAVEELREASVPPGHLAAYRERWGRLPG